MSSQNRMNAGAEYVLYRIWATLQGEKGIHAESLLTCVGALAGYACQAYVRQAGALPSADPSRYALQTVDASDGTKYLAGDALMRPLVESSLSIWSLVSRTLQKLGEPLPDVQDIASHVTQTLGTSTFGIPRAADEHRPERPAIVYLRQLWPQVLPIAQRFCRKPMQLPVLFGIALQRALEFTTDRLPPTLGASIAMECAIAMSKVVLPDAPPITAATRAPARVVGSDKTAGSGTFATSLTTLAASLVQKTRNREQDRTVSDEGLAPRLLALAKRLPPAARLATIASVAFIALTGVLYTADSQEAQAARASPPIRNEVLTPGGTPLPESLVEPGNTLEPERALAPEPQLAAELPPPEEPAPPNAASTPNPLFDGPVPEWMEELVMMQPQKNTDFDDEMVIRN